MLRESPYRTAQPGTQEDDQPADAHVTHRDVKTVENKSEQQCPSGAEVKLALAHSAEQSSNSNMKLIKHVSCSHVSNKKREKFAAVFSERSNSFIDKTYDMPYALKEKVDLKLSKMVQAGSLSKVSFNNWASPIVVVPKKTSDEGRGISVSAAARITRWAITLSGFMISSTKRKGKKWNAKGIPGILVGYHGFEDGYRVYVPNKRKTCTTHDVLFKQERAVAEDKLTGKEVSCFQLHDEEKNKEPPTSVSPNYSREEHECEQRSQNGSGRFIVKLPLKNNYNTLGHFQENAIRQFQSIERKLVKNPNLYKEYRNFMKKYALGHMDLQQTAWDIKTILV
ncbi:hypothetical protein ILUMI_23696 [Ignelater luminosus]|uniref:Retroviral polymerase SH3-like domain-containing protein n=1 Tax=Ignelater luminosus TaxID=2038154 RepID=A0A8K0CBL2_IGNLU|nr:hypothetical protein ILUMI_23696 [Ignelater luminosus]